MAAPSCRYTARAMAIRNKPSNPTRKVVRKRSRTHVQRDPTLLADLLAIANSIPAESLARLPRDGALNHDHYIYGTPKKYP
jgi:hypothetical protein